MPYELLLNIHDDLAGTLSQHGAASEDKTITRVPKALLRFIPGGLFLENFTNSEGERVVIWNLDMLTIMAIVIFLNDLKTLSRR